MSRDEQGLIAEEHIATHHFYGFIATSSSLIITVATYGTVRFKLDIYSWVLL